MKNDPEQSLPDWTRACVTAFQSCLLHSGDMLDSSTIIHGKMLHFMVPGNTDHKNDSIKHFFYPENISLSGENDFTTVKLQCVENSVLKLQCV